jgi:hypothetical protein
VTTAIILPVTTRERSITGIPALSVPCDGMLKDWHFSTAFSGKKPLPIAGVARASTEYVWLIEDVDDPSDYFRSASGEVTGAVYVASPPRAIADLLQHLLSRGEDREFLCVDQIPMSDRSMLRL